MRAFAGVEQGRGHGPARQTPNEGYSNRSSHSDIFDELGMVAWVTRNHSAPSCAGVVQRRAHEEFLLTREQGQPRVFLIYLDTVRGFSCSARRVIRIRV